MKKWCCSILLCSHRKLSLNNVNILFLKLLINQILHSFIQWKGINSSLLDKMIMESLEFQKSQIRTCLVTYQISFTMRKLCKLLLVETTLWFWQQTIFMHLDWTTVDSWEMVQISQNLFQQRYQISFLMKNACWFLVATNLQ